MSASERLRELESRTGDGVSLYALEDALPEIVAVVEAAEAQSHYMRAIVWANQDGGGTRTAVDLAAALAALKEKLKP